MMFTAVIELSGKTATGIPVPPEVITSLGQGRRPQVRVTVGGHTYRSSVGVMSGRFLVPLSAEHRAAAGVAAGDEVAVEIAVDTEPRDVDVPPELARALEGDPIARRVFDSLSYSQRHRYALEVLGAKTPQTRDRRIAQAITDLRQRAR